MQNDGSQIFMKLVNQDIKLRCENILFFHRSLQGVATSLLLALTPAFADCPGLVMKADQVVLDTPGALNDNKVTIPFQQVYDTPPLVFILPHNSNPDPLTVRIVNVTTSDFTVGLSETPGEDGNVPSEDIHYLAIEAGEFTFSPAMELKVGSQDLQNFVTKLNNPDSSYAAVNYPSAFNAANPEPLTFSEVQTINNTPGHLFAVGTTQDPWFDSITLNGNSTRSLLRLSLDVAETGDGTNITDDETVAYLAINSGTTTFLDNSGTTITLTSGQTPDNVTGNCVANPHGNSGANTPIAIANKTNRDGADGGLARLCSIDNTNINMQVDEDQTFDGEQNHTTERIDVITFSQAFTVKDSLGLPDMEAQAFTVIPPNITAPISFASVSFSKPFVSTPNIFVMPTDEEARPATVRIKNVTTTGFDIAQFQPEGETGAADSMTIDYFAIVDGVTTMPGNDITFEAGSINTSSQQGSNVTSSGPDTITFAESYTIPSFLIDIQTNNSEPGLDPDSVSVPWLETYVSTVTPTEATVALERVKTANGTISTEKLSYLVTESGNSTQFMANGGDLITFKSLNTPVEINGWDDVFPTCENYSYPSGVFSQTPLSIGNMITRNGPDGGWLRKCRSNSNASQISLVVDEDESDGSDRSHGANEAASVLGFSQAFEWCPPALELTKTSEILEDPVNGTANPKHIPGAFVKYTLYAKNQGRVPLDIDTVILKDVVPTSSALYVGTDPAYVFAMTDGVLANASGLTTFNYAGAASATDDVEFSNDGGSSWGHTPIADADGFDSSDTTHVRFNPKGEFSGGNASSTPEFTLTFTTKITP